ncbi:hypothetical protein M8J76_005902 [Diaphorina citri]|nr:hypothetical protein M8J76_005902 [Diaphorina citri]
MSQFNDAWSWGQESSETNEDNSASTDPIDWDDNNSWGTSWDNVETIQPAETLNNEKFQQVQQPATKTYTPLQNPRQNNEQRVYGNNMNSYSQDTTQHYRQHTHITENHNYNQQEYATQYPYQQQYQQQYVDHTNNNFNYTQEPASHVEVTKTNEYHQGQGFKQHVEQYSQHGNTTGTVQHYEHYTNNQNNLHDTNFEIYQNNDHAQILYNNPADTNHGVYENNNQEQTPAANQNTWFNPTQHVQTPHSYPQHNQIPYEPIQTPNTAYPASSNNNVNAHVGNSASPEVNNFVSPNNNFDMGGNSVTRNSISPVRNINEPFQSEPRATFNYETENNEHALCDNVEIVQTTPSISLGGSNKNSWYQDDYDMGNTSDTIASNQTQKSVDNNINTTENSFNHENTLDISLASNQATLGSTNFNYSVENEEQLTNNTFTENTNELDMPMLDKLNISAVSVEQTLPNETDLNSNVRPEPSSTDVLHEQHENNVICDNTIEDGTHQSNDLPNTEQQSNTELIKPYDIVQEINLNSNVTQDSLDKDNTVPNVEDISSANITEPSEEVVAPIPYDRDTTASPYDNVQNIPDAHVEDNTIIKTNEENKQQPGDSNEEPHTASMKISDRVKGGPKKYAHNNWNKTNVKPVEANVEKPLNESNVAMDKLSRLKRSTEKTTKDRNQYLETGELQDTRSPSEDEDYDVAPSFDRMIPGSEMNDPNQTQPSSTNKKLNTNMRNQSSSYQSDESMEEEEEEEEEEVEDKKLVKLIKLIMSEEKGKKQKVRNNKDNVETTALRIAKILKAQKQASKLVDSDAEEEEAPGVQEHHNANPPGHLSHFEMYLNSLPRRKDRTMKPSITSSSPIPLDERLSTLSLHSDKPPPQHTPTSQRTGRRYPSQSFSERSMKSPFTDLSTSTIDRRKPRSGGDGFSSHLQFLNNILANFPNITEEQSARMKQLTLSYPLEYKAWYMESYLPTLKRYKQVMNERNIVIRNRINKQFGKHCIGKARLRSLLKFDAAKILEYNIDVERAFYCSEDSNYMHEIELLTPFTFDNEDKKCFYGFIQSMIHRATSQSEQLLYQLIELVFKSKGEVELSDIGDLLLRSYSKLKGLQYLRYHTSLWKPNNTQDINFKLRQHSVNNQKQKAFQLALQSKDWALATVLSSGPNSGLPQSEVHQAFLNTLPVNDPLRPCFQLMFNQSLQVNNSTTPIDLNDWGIHLAAILNNSTSDTIDTAAVLKLGHLLGDKGDYYAEQFCTLSVNAAWSRFKLLGAGCYDNQDEISLENVVTGRNLLLSMAYENATKLGAANNRGYQFVQLQYMKYYFSLKLLRLGKSKMALHFLHHASEEILAHLSEFCTPKHLPLLGEIVDLVMMCAGEEVHNLLWFTQLQHLLVQHVPSRRVQLAPLYDEQPAPSPSLHTDPPNLESRYSNPEPTPPQSLPSTTQYAPTLSSYGDMGQQDPTGLNPARQTPMSEDPARFNPSGHPGTNNPMGKPPLGSSGDPMGYSAPRMNTLSGGNSRTSAFNMPQRSNPARPNPIRGNTKPVLSSPGDRAPIQSDEPRSSQSVGVTRAPQSQFFTPALVPDAESTYQQHLQDSESSASMNVVSLNSSFSYTAQDGQKTDLSSSGGQQVSSGGDNKPNSAGATGGGGGWFGFLKKNNAPASAPSSAPGGYPAPAYSAPPPNLVPSTGGAFMQPYSADQAGYYQSQQQSIND